MSGGRVACGAVACSIVVAAAISPAAAENAEKISPPSVVVRPRFSAETLRATFTHREGDGLANPACTVPVGEQTRQAFTDLVGRLFGAPPPDGPGAELEVSLAGANVDYRMGGWFAVVEHRIALTAVTGAELGRWSVQSDEPIVGEDERAVPSAFARAAEASAHKVEVDLRRSPPRWVGGTATEPAIAWAPRSPYSIYLDVGSGLVTAASGADGGVFARGGVAVHSFFVQLTGGAWSTMYAPGRANVGSDVDLSTIAVGLETGPVYRLGRAWELRAGLGVQVLHGHANQTLVVKSGPFGNGTTETSFPFTRVAPTLFASLLFVGGDPARSGARLRMGVEARGYFGTELSYAEYPTSSKIVEATLGFFVGFELPWGARPTRPGVSGR